MMNYFKALQTAINKKNNQSKIETTKDMGENTLIDFYDFGIKIEYIKENNISKKDNLKIEDETTQKQKQLTYDRLIIYLNNVLLLGKTQKEYIITLLTKELKKLIGLITSQQKILVVGMGNQFMLADSLGSEIAKNLEPTSHLKNEKEFQNIPSLSVFIPNVLGVTGIETADSINAICNLVKPDFILALDSLCANSLSRFCSTIQISSDGITPGAGINNARKKLSEENLNCKVIAVGVPLMINTEDILNDTKKIETYDDYKTILTSANINELVVFYSKIISASIINLILK